MQCVLLHILELISLCCACIRVFVLVFGFVVLPTPILCLHLVYAELHMSQDYIFGII